MTPTLKEKIDQYNDLDWNQILRKDLGTYSLEEAKPIFDRIKLVFDTIINHPELEEFPTQFQTSVEQHLTSFIGFTTQIVNNFQNTAERDSWLNKIKNQEFEIKQSIGPFYTDLVLRDPGRNAELKSKTVEAQEQLQSIKDQLDSSEQLLKAAQDRAQEVEAGTYGTFFGTRSGKNETNARKARKGIVWSTLGTIVLAFLFLSGESNTLTEVPKIGELLNDIFNQGFLLKLVILSLGGYSIAHFSRDYVAEKHLQNVNIQRQNALDSHQQMLKSIRPTESENDKETANAMLAELTRAIFEIGDTGYLKKTSNPGNPIRQAIELTKSDK